MKLLGLALDIGALIDFEGCWRGTFLDRCASQCQTVIGWRRVEEKKHELQ
jgi:hypothetical protein